MWPAGVSVPSLADTAYRVGAFAGTTAAGVAPPGAPLPYVSG